MEVKRNALMWTSRLSRVARWHHSKQVSTHAKNSIEALYKLNPRVPPKAHLKRGTIHLEAWSIRAFQRWRSETLTGNAKSRCLDKVSQIAIDKDILDSPLLSEQKKRSALRFIV